MCDAAPLWDNTDITVDFHRIILEKLKQKGLVSHPESRRERNEDRKELKTHPFPSSSILQEFEYKAKFPKQSTFVTTCYHVVRAKKLLFVLSDLSLNVMIRYRMLVPIAI